MYVSNLPGDVKKGDLWRDFKVHGEIVDVYIAQKRDSNKKFFAFVRYKGVKSGKDLETSLQNMIFAGRKLDVNISKFDRKHKVWDRLGPKKPSLAAPLNLPHKSGFRDSRPFASVVAESYRPPPPPPLLNATPTALRSGTAVSDWSSGDLTFVGVAISLDHLNSFNPFVVMGDDEAFLFKYIGGLSLLVKFRSAEDVEAFSAVSQDWFSSFKKGVSLMSPKDRIVWIKIIGLPCLLWDSENFSRIAADF